MPDHDWIADRAVALTVMCPYCHALIGELCTAVRSVPLEHFPAHLVRTKAARATS